MAKSRYPEKTVDAVQTAVIQVDHGFSLREPLDYSFSMMARPGIWRLPVAPFLFLGDHTVALIELIHLDGPGIVYGSRTFCKVNAIAGKGDGAISFTCDEPDGNGGKWKFAVAEKDAWHLFSPKAKNHGDERDFVGCFFMLVTEGGAVRGRPVEKTDWTVSVRGEASRELMRCRVCGCLFNPERLDEVFTHEHSAALDPDEVAEIEGKKVG